VNTHISTFSEMSSAKKPIWMRDKVYTWCAPELRYSITTHDDVKVPLKKDLYFETFSRKIPTRFEVEMDELFERLCFGWETGKAVDLVFK
jgi:hypothetical protein